MGMDLYGKTESTYFRANVWSWRPIHCLCDIVIEHYKLKINTDGWQDNSGFGLENEEDCFELAKRIEQYLEQNDYNAEDDETTIYCNLGMWLDDEGSIVSGEKEEWLNSLHPIHTIFRSPAVMNDGKLYYPAYSVTLWHLKKFIEFLRECGGGFQIF